ncbi:glycosyltransferase [Lyngbya confervoides]|uniref:Glycosyltransferase n=1 Tax=Lyngbya confervoides BDU141951 TaxID=1574623 RepID=A0ABD4SYL9_9CYAN|nr:glycosyltransferase [Lyngbya confervoides]MCM1981526.1 glycosyltransferase [Lyngbya confervoides BDU141951]
MKIALVHDYLTQKGGAERVFELLCQHFPNADIFTSLYDPLNTVDLGKGRPVRTTYLQMIPGASRFFRLLAPFYYHAFRSLDLQAYDLVISSSTSFAKAVRTRPDAVHVCFCHNVTRFLWDTQNYLSEYSNFRRMSTPISMGLKLMRRADRRYAQTPDLYIANSSTVAERIRKYYGRQALVVNYPIDQRKFIFSAEKDDFCLVSSRMLSYKKIDVTIAAFNQLGWPLKVVGEGPESGRLRAMAKPNVEFLGYVPDAQRAQLMARARYVIVSALEDYGLVPIEANASGTPVICYGVGGVRDTQIPGKTGLFFAPQTPAALIEALMAAESLSWDHQAIRDHALSNFAQTVFFQQIDQILAEFADLRALRSASQLTHALG